jgi:hypothetical protein
VSTRSLIIADISTRLAAVAPVSSWRTHPYPVASLPAIAWRDDLERSDDTTIGLPPRWRLRMAIAGYSDGTTGDIRDMMDAMLAAVGSDIRHTGLAEGTDLLSTNLMVSSAADVVAAGVITIDIFYRSPVNESLPGDGSYLIDETGAILTDEQGDRLTW